MDPRSLDAFRSPSDKKHYRLLTLPNGLEALVVHGDKRVNSGGDTEIEPEPEEEDDFAPRRSLVNRAGDYDTESESGSDSEADDDSDGEGSHEPVEKGTPHAAACLSVAVGSMADPQDMRGLAHYLEHMLFMSSAKYPDENEFEAFLSAHGGYSNGTTECESTRFLFEVAPAFLQPALDMFAQFFVAPLFKADAMERELLAVESEFNRARQNDYVRLQQVQCETCAPGNPYNSFSWGNVDSLKREPERNGRNVRDEMIAFYKTHYSAHCMKLCVYGEDSLDDLERWVRESFGAIPTSRAVPTLRVPMPFGEAAGQHPTLIKIVPVRKMHSLHLYWPMPPMLDQYRQKPWEFLSHAMGHEADGSLSAILKQRMWSTEVSIGISENDAYEFGSFGSLFEVNVVLTRLGLSHWEDVVALVFDLVRFLREQAPSNPWIFNELRATSRMNYQFQEESNPLSLCRRFAELMQDRHAVLRDDLLRYDLLQGEFDADMTQELLALMTPQNTRVLLLSHAFEEDESVVEWRSEKWLGVKYSVEAIAEPTLAKWKSQTMPPVVLRLPEPNPFLPEDFTVLPLPSVDGDAKPLDPDGEPLLVFTTPMSKLWYKRDLKFQIPKTNANFLLCLPSLTRNVRSYIHAKIYLRLCHEALQHVQYQAYLASYSYELSLRDLDIETTFSGFSDKLPALIDAVFSALLHTEVDDAVFTRVRDELTKEYRNLTLKPAVKARYLRLQLLERTTFPVEDKLEVLSNVTVAEVREFKDCFMWQCEATIRAMVHGNISQDEAVALLESVEQSIDDYTSEQRLPPLRSPLRPHTTALPLTTNGLLLRDLSDHDGETNSFVEVYYQFGKGGYQDLAYAELLQHVMADPLFNELRTKQQLGYEVFCTVRETHGVLGFSIAVQSASHAAGEIALHVDEFVHVEFLRFLEQFPPEELAKHVASLQRMKTREDVTLSEESDRYWEEIQSRRLEFRIDDHVVKELSQCSVAELQERYLRWLVAANEGDETGAKDAAKVRKLRVHMIGKNSKFVKPLETLVAKDQAPVLIANWREYKAALACHCSNYELGHSSHHSQRHSHTHDHRRGSRCRGRSLSTN